MHITPKQVEEIQKLVEEITGKINQISVCVVELIIDTEATGGDPRYLFPLLKLVDSDALSKYLENRRE